MIPSMGDIRRRHRRDGTPYADRWQIRWTDASGRRRSEQVRGNKSTAAAILAERVRSVAMQRAGLGDAVRQTADIRALAEEWISEATWSSSHSRNVRSDLPRLLDELNAVEVRDVSLATVLRWRSRAGGSHRTINRRLGYLRALLRWALATSRIARDPLDGLRPLPVLEAHRERIRHVLTEPEARALIHAARRWDDGREPQQALVAEVMYACGLRPSEAYRLSWRDWDGVSLRVRPGKTGTGRVVPVPGWLADRLSSSRARRGLRHGRPDDPILPGVRWARYTTERGAIGRIWREWLAMAGLPEVTAAGRVIDREALRHTYAHRLKAAGVPIAQAMELMGHRSARMLTEVYGRAELGSGWTMPDPMSPHSREEKESC